MNKLSIIGKSELGLNLSTLFEKSGYDVLIDDLKDESSLEHILSHSDFLFITVETSLNDDGTHNHGNINTILREMDYRANGVGINKKQKHIILCSVVMPGYTRSIVKRMNDINYTITYNPEFSHFDTILIGETNKTATKELKNIYESLFNKPTFHIMSTISAEIAKMSLTCYVSNKIALANSIGDLCLSVGAEYKKVLKAIGSDSRVGNKSFEYGYGYGGPFFYKNNLSLNEFSKLMGREILFSKFADESNKQHLDNQLKDFKRKHNDKDEEIIIEDVAYKKGTDVVEESQKLLFASKLVDEGYDVKIVDSDNVIKNVKEVFKNKFTYEEINENSK